MPHAALIPRGAGEPQASEIAEAERLAVALKSAAGDLSRAAALLKIPRSTLLHRLQKLGLLPKGDEPAP
jgi:transcriptional regulator of acetoin/glycerol metabolism